jgi:hypothetical protein
MAKVIMSESVTLEGVQLPGQSRPAIRTRPTCAGASRPMARPLQ